MPPSRSAVRSFHSGNAVSPGMESHPDAAVRRRREPRARSHGISRCLRLFQWQESRAELAAISCARDDGIVSSRLAARPILNADRPDSSSYLSVPREIQSREKEWSVKPNGDIRDRPRCNSAAGTAFAI